MALKPTILSLENDPIELRAWTTQFNAFYRTSNIDQCTILDQQAYLVSYMDAHLKLTMTDNIALDTALFGNGGCFDVLERLFLERYPLFRRRETFFMADFNGHIREVVSFVAKLTKLAQSGECEQLGLDDLVTYKALSVVKDKELRRLCAREDNLTKARYCQLALQRAREVETFEEEKLKADSLNAISNTKDKECYYCGILGHIATDCRKRVREEALKQGTAGTPAVPTRRPAGRPATPAARGGRGGTRGRGRGGRRVRIITSEDGQETEYPLSDEEEEEEKTDPATEAAPQDQDSYNVEQ
jgi:hypothetical protein